MTNYLFFTSVLNYPKLLLLNHPHLDGLITHFWLAVEKLVLWGHPIGDVDKPVSPVSLDLPALTWVVRFFFLLPHLIQTWLSSFITQLGLPSLILQPMEYSSRWTWGWSLCPSKTPSAHSLHFGKVILLCLSNFFPFLFSSQPGLWANQIRSQIIKHILYAVRQSSNWYLSLSSGPWILSFTKADEMVVFIVAVYQLLLMQLDSYQ